MNEKNEQVKKLAKLVNTTLSTLDNSTTGMRDCKTFKIKTDTKEGALDLMGEINRIKTIPYHYELIPYSDLHSINCVIEGYELIVKKRGVCVEY